MKKFISVIIALALLLLYFTGINTVFANDRNIIFSDSFETGTFLNSWKYMNDASLGFVRVTDSCSTDGENALYLWDDKIDASVGIKSVFIEINPGTVYTLTADIYRKSATICLYLKYYTSEGEFISSATKSRTASGNGWKNYAISAIAPTNAKYIEINIVTNVSTQGYGYYDNIKIIEGEIGSDSTVSGTIPPENEDIYVYDRVTSSVNNDRIYYENFEYGIDAWSEFTNTSDLYFEISALNKLSGTNSLHFIDNSTTQYPEIYSPSISVEEGDTYKFSINSKKVSGSMAVHYKFYSAEDIVLENTSLGVQGKNGEWNNTSKTVVAPEGASYLRFLVVGYTNTVGEWYIDDLEVFKINDVFNEDFEDGLENWTNFENTSDMSVEISQKEKVSGTVSLHIIDNSTTKAPLITSSKINVKEGTEYRISASGKRISGSVTVNYRFYSIDDTQLNNISVGLQANGNDWYHATKTVIAPKGAAYFKFVIAGYTNTVGEWYIDDIVLSLPNGIFEESVNESYAVPVQNESKDAQIVAPSGDILTYESYNKEGDKLADYSHAGFYNSEYELPVTENFPVDSELFSIDASTDDTYRIQNAIDQASKNAGDGMRVVKLKAGKYKIGPPGIKMKPGVILSGEGQGPSGTILYAYVPVQYTVISALGGKSTDEGNPVYVTDFYIKSGSKTINVSLEDAKKFQAGDLIAFRYPYTNKWVEAMNMDTVENFDGVFTSWNGKINPTVERTIVAINGTELTLDFPFFIPYDQSYNDTENKTYIVKLSTLQRMENIGIENLRIESYYNGQEDDEKHALHGISLHGVENAFVRDVTGKYLYSSVVRCVEGTKKVTVLNCSSLEPVSKIQGDRRYSFFSSADTQQILFTGCYSYAGRHDYSTSSYTAGPIAFVDNISDGSNDSSETHAQWSVGVLYDNIRLIEPAKTGMISLANRGKWGTLSSGSHGWTAAGSVVWNSLSSSIVVHKPPLTYQNFAVGNYGNYTDSVNSFYKDINVKRYQECYGAGSESFSDDNFYNVEGSSLYGDSYQENQIYSVNPKSLFKAQLAERITGSIKNARPNSPTLVYPFCDLETSSQSITFEGFCDAGAKEVTIYVDNTPYKATINSLDSTYTLTLLLDFGTHKVYATQTIEGNEGNKTADRFLSIGHVSSDTDKLQSAYHPSETTLLINDNRKTFDDYITKNSVYLSNNILGSGTLESPYIIDTPEKFTSIFGENNTDASTYGEDKYYKVTEDLIIKDHKCNKLVFKGVLYADENKTLNFVTLPKNQMWIDKSLSSEWGFNTDYRCASAVLFAFIEGGTIRNITINGTMPNTNSHYQGAFAAFAKAATIEDCINNVDMTGISPGENGGVGGFIGATKESTPATVISNCVNNGDITGKTAVGGFVGDSYTGNITSCENTGNIISNIAWGAAGGFVGYQRTGVTLSKCVNSGKVTAGTNVANYSAGGFVGCVTSNVYGTRKVVVTESINLGEIESLNATLYPGAIIGFSQGNIEIKNTMNLGAVIGGAGQGRAIGNLKKASGKTITIENYYDIAVVGARKAIASTYTNLTVLITNAYGLSEAPDEKPVSNELNNVSSDTLKNLVSSGKFSEDMWEINKDNIYPYPTLKNNPYFVVVPENLATGSDVFISDLSEDFIIGGQIYKKYALIAAKAPFTLGLTLKEFGVIAGDNFDITIENCKMVFTADNNKISQPSGTFGCLLYEKEDTINGFKNDKTYIVRPYAIYEDITKKEYTIYGKALNFTFKSN